MESSWYVHAPLYAWTRSALSSVCSDGDVPTTPSDPSQPVKTRSPTVCTKVRVVFQPRGHQGQP